MFTDSVPSLVTFEFSSFGSEYLVNNKLGMLGSLIVVSIKLIQILSVPSLLLNKWIKICSILNIIILLNLVVLINYSNGWFVVEKGTNDIEYSFLVIFIFVSFLMPKGIKASFEFPDIDLNIKDI